MLSVEPDVRNQEIRSCFSNVVASPARVSSSDCAEVLGRAAFSNDTAKAYGEMVRSHIPSTFNGPDPVLKQTKDEGRAQFRLAAGSDASQ